MDIFARNIELCNKLAAINEKRELEGVDVALIDALLEELMYAQRELASLLGDEVA